MSAPNEPQVLAWMGDERQQGKVRRRFGGITVVLVVFLLGERPGEWVRVSQSYLAGIAVASREGVNRALRVLRLAGIVSTERRIGRDGEEVGWVRLNLAALRRFLNGLPDHWLGLMEKARASVQARKAAWQAARSTKQGCDVASHTSVGGSLSSEQGVLVAALAAAKALHGAWMPAAQAVMRDHPGVTLGQLVALED